MKSVTIYTTTYCPYCVRVKELLQSLDVEYTEVNVENEPELRDEIIAKYQWQTVPLIVIGDECIGGFDDLNKLHQNGELKQKLQ